MSVQNFVENQFEAGIDSNNNTQPIESSSVPAVPEPTKLSLEEYNSTSGIDGYTKKHPIESSSVPALPEPTKLPAEEYNSTSVARMPGTEDVDATNNNTSEMLQIRQMLMQLNERVTHITNQQQTGSSASNDKAMIPSPFKEASEVHFELGGKSKKKLRIISDNDEFIVPVEFLNYTDNVLTDKNSKKRARHNNNTPLGAAPICANVGESNNTTLAQRKYKKVCRYCGVQESPGIPISNQGCPLHRNYAKLYKRTVNKAKRVNTNSVRRCFPSNYISENTMLKFGKITSYWRDVISPSTLQGWYFGGITSEIGAYQCLKKHGLAFVPSLLHITDKNFEFLLAAMSSWDWKDQLFTSFDPHSGGEIFLNNPDKNRWVTTEKDYISVVRNWIELERKISEWLNDRSNFPPGGRPWSLKWSAFKTSKDMHYPQAFHLDVGPHRYGYVRQQWFSFSLMIGIEELSYLDYQDKNGQIFRIGIRRGDVLAFRGDIPHGGTENAANHTHYRIHVYVDSAKLREEMRSDADRTIPCDDMDHLPMVYNVEKQSWERRNLDENMALNQMEC